MIYKRKNRAAIKKKPFAFTAVGDIRELMGRNIQLFGENLPVAGRLVQHEHIVGVL